MKKLTGPFSQILPHDGLAMHGAIEDSALRIIENGGIVIENGIILETGIFNELYAKYPGITVEETTTQNVLIPGFIDCHTHICFAGHRAKDYSLRIQGKSYLEIAKSGGGIWDSVTQTRLADEECLTALLQGRVERHLSEGVTTIEVKSGYGLDIANELKQLRAIKKVSTSSATDLVPTCLAAHLPPKDFDGHAVAYLDHLIRELLPLIKKENLTNRIDIFIEEGAFSSNDARKYLQAAKVMGFELTVHADQFSTGGLEVALASGALSADHLEATSDKEIPLLKNAPTVAVVLPGASLGLGMSYAPARRFLDSGACLAIASDWNPGSAPMGDLLMQAAVMSASEKLSTAEVFAGLTFRAAKALGLNDRGVLKSGMLADLQAYSCNDYREILYHQGKMKPVHVWKKGIQIAEV
ncbi:imidazolonepropionase [Pedobacter westerhofensis]|uniref:Imidazolonepropionase n=1 Tax=Pedobacter westerhofensis TaxID=425512 RepID=A0A521BAK5_9SPHI|nr:imidazolonepropionase [Pedobacter westerhofensis]SMO44031.1 imidazolonepropionase [Pedobacter westerhofensis]